MYPFRIFGYNFRHPAYGFIRIIGTATNQRPGRLIIMLVTGFDNGNTQRWSTFKQTRRHTDSGRTATDNDHIERIAPVTGVNCSMMDFTSIRFGHGMQCSCAFTRTAKCKHRPRQFRHQLTKCFTAFFWYGTHTYRQIGKSDTQGFCFLLQLFTGWLILTAF